MEPACAFSGHRPEKLPWGDNREDPRCQALMLMMERQLRQLCEEGCLRYLCGMARGTDRYFLEILAKLRREYPLTVTAVIPCPSQSQGWSGQEQREYLQTLDLCDNTVVLEERYSQGVMLRRNRYMVEHATMLMTVFDGSPGGTAATVRYARARGLRIIALWR